MTTVSTDTPWETLPALSPAVITTRRVPRPPCPAMHLTDVSDSHSVPSHPVCPSRPMLVYDTSPRPAPCTVTDADPVVALFIRRVALTRSLSTDQLSVMLPCLSPAVMVTRRVPLVPCDCKHLTDVSDSHSVPSHPVSLARKLVVYSARPSPIPATVIEADPVLARFLPLQADIVPSLYDMLSDNDPLRSPTVTICIVDALLPNGV